MIRLHTYLALLPTLALLMLGAHGGALGDCGRVVEARDGHGPFDYTNYSARERGLRIVEQYHFSPDDEALVGRPARYIAQDISYTLTKFPNHHRALDAMSRLAVREGQEHPVGSYYSIDCWFQRAVVFQPRDGRVRMLYGTHLSRIGRNEEALEHIQAGLKLQPDDPRIQHALARLYFDMGDFENAAHYARQAVAAGYPIGSLEKDLVDAGHWFDEGQQDHVHDAQAD